MFLRPEIRHYLEVESDDVHLARCSDAGGGAYTLWVTEHQNWVRTPAFFIIATSAGEANICRKYRTSRSGGMLSR